MRGVTSQKGVGELVSEGLAGPERAAREVRSLVKTDHV